MSAKCWNLNLIFIHHYELGKQAKAEGKIRLDMASPPFSNTQIHWRNDCFKLFHGDPLWVHICYFYQVSPGIVQRMQMAMVQSVANQGTGKPSF